MAPPLKNAFESGVIEGEWLPTKVARWNMKTVDPADGFKVH